MLRGRSVFSFLVYRRRLAAFDASVSGRASFTSLNYSPKFLLVRGGLFAGKRHEFENFLSCRDVCVISAIQCLIASAFSINSQFWHAHAR